MLRCIIFMDVDFTALRWGCGKGGDGFWGKFGDISTTLIKFAFQTNCRPDTAAYTSDAAAAKQLSR